MQKNIWEKEYQNPKLVTKYNKPQSFFIKFLKWFEKYSQKPQKSISYGFWERIKVLDLGSGTGRNANYMAQKGADAIGMEISTIAIKIAERRAEKLDVDVNYLSQNIGSKYPFENEYFNLVIDITASNSLKEKERKIYLSEVKRVLIKDGIFFVRALCKDGDKNAKNLLKISPGKEKDTYIMPDTGLVERVFSKDDFIKIYSKYFEILKLEKTESYSTVNGKLYKRKFWLAIMKK